MFLFSFFIRGGFAIASLSSIIETWLRIVEIPYRFEIKGDGCKIIVEHDTRLKYLYLIREISRYLLELRDGNIDQIARRLCTINTIDSVEIHIGNSDLIANMLYKDNKQLLQTIADIKKIEGVDRMLWSEQVYNIKSNNSII